MNWDLCWFVDGQVLLPRNRCVGCVVSCRAPSALSVCCRVCCKAEVRKNTGAGRASDGPKEEEGAKTRKSEGTNRASWLRGERTPGSCWERGGGASDRGEIIKKKIIINSGMAGPRGSQRTMTG